MAFSTRDLARHLELTLPLPDATAQEIEQLLGAARSAAVVAVCLFPARVLLGHHLLLDSDVKVCAYVGFPFGATEGEIKAHETELAIELGAQEIEVGMNLGRLKDGDDRGVLRELRDVVEAADGVPVKVVVESARLASAERERAASLIVESGARFLVSGSGFAEPKAEDVRAWRDLVGRSVGIKAAGSIRSLEAALSLMEAGADRVGTPEALAILQAHAESPKPD